MQATYGRASRFPSEGAKHIVDDLSRVNLLQHQPRNRSWSCLSKHTFNGDDTRFNRSDGLAAMRTGAKRRAPKLDRGPSWSRLAQAGVCRDAGSKMREQSARDC